MNKDDLDAEVKRIILRLASYHGLAVNINTRIWDSPKVMGGNPRAIFPYQMAANAAGQKYEEIPLAAYRFILTDRHTRSEIQVTHIVMGYGPITNTLYVWDLEVLRLTLIDLIRIKPLNAIFDAAEAYWPAMVNRDRTRVIFSHMPTSDQERHEAGQVIEHLQQIVAEGKAESMEYTFEDVGPFRMAFDPVRDWLIVADDFDSNQLES
jgi:hypothetical protein